MIDKTFFFTVLFLAAGAVSAATTTLSQTQTQTVDGENFTFAFAPGSYQAGSSSSFTITVQGDFDDISPPGSTAITLGNAYQGNFNRTDGYDVTNPGFSNINTYLYKLDFFLNPTETDDFMTNPTVLVDFASDVQQLCGWWNFSNCNVLSGDAPFAEVTYTYEVSAVPVPAAVWLFGSALFGLATIARRKKA